MELLSTTWTGNNSYTTTIDGSFQINRISIHYDASISNDTTVIVDRIDGTNYDELITTFDNSSGVTDNLVTFSDKELRLGTGDQIKVACNVGTDNAYLTIDYMYM